jgi:molybdopterin/thiamine biosynthesis adenylyltransferase
MTKYSVTFCEHDFETVCRLLFDNATTERGLYLLVGLSSAAKEQRLLVRSVIPIVDEDIISASTHHLSVSSKSYLKAIRQADREGMGLVFVHSHPHELPDHSPQDDDEERALFRTAYNRIHGRMIHGSIVFSSPTNPVGRVWLPTGDTAPITRVRVVGNRFRFHDRASRTKELHEYFDRQVRAFGADTQRLLSSLTIGIVGLGGTGSAVFEQLVRLGVSNLIVADPQDFEISNLNRVYGSRVSDQGQPKVAIAERVARETGTTIHVEGIKDSITRRSVLSRFRACDVIFGCTDDEWGRSLLTRLAIFYCIPVFDMGVQIDSEDGFIQSVQGRVTTLMPSRACLFCRQRVSSDGVAAEVMRILQPDKADLLAKEGYAPELQEPAPAVIAFTTTVAATAVTELLSRLTGFLGIERRGSEVIHRFSHTRLGTNDRPPSPDCFCGDPYFWGLGDVEPFLDVTWRPE